MFNKYHCIRTEIDNFKFASRKEARRYQELKLLSQGKIIDNLELQPKFVLQQAFDCNGEHYREIAYIADFKYIDKETGKTIVEDVKGIRTDVYSLKLKLFLFKFGNSLTFTEI